MLEAAPEDPTGANCASPSAAASGRLHGPPRNAAVLIDRTGRVLYDFAKVHTVLNSDLEGLTAAGRVFPTVLLHTARGAVRVGTFVCFDREHPESAAVLARHGAELILVPTACYMGQGMQFELAAMAKEHRVGIAMANYAEGAHSGLNKKTHSKTPRCFLLIITTHTQHTHTQLPGMPMMNGGSSAHDWSGARLLYAGAAEAMPLADFDVTALRAARAAAAGDDADEFDPALCTLRKAANYAPEQSSPGYGWANRANDGL
jgi:predicted amidohydrolase